jgi:hypothetical protein
MCKELPVILVNKVVDQKRIIRQKWRAEEEERHKGSLTHKKRFEKSIVNFFGERLLATALTKSYLNKQS